MPSSQFPTEEQSSSLSSKTSDGAVSDSNSLSLNIDNEEEVGLRRGPLVAQFIPIVFPAEPSLDELLRQQTGRDDIANITHIKLSVLSEKVSLQRLHLFTPQLVSLNLSGSGLSSLRDLGCEFHSLKHLNISRCGLRSLDGICGFPLLESLEAEFNGIAEIGNVYMQSELKLLNMKGNVIKKLNELQFLSLCGNLVNLILAGNPVANLLQYRSLVKQQIPQLQYLDGELYPGSDKQLSCGSDLSSCSLSELSSPSSFNDSLNNLDTIQPELNISTEEKKISVSPSLTNGPAVCGTIVSKMRKMRKHPLPRSSTSTGSNEATIFPDVLQQVSVDLELGVIGMRHSLGIEMQHRDRDVLQDAARRWRKKAQNTREKALQMSDSTTCNIDLIE